MKWGHIHNNDRRLTNSKDALLVSWQGSYKTKKKGKSCMPSPWKKDGRKELRNSCKWIYLKSLIQLIRQIILNAKIITRFGELKETNK